MAQGTTVSFSSFLSNFAGGGASKFTANDIVRSQGAKEDDANADTKAKDIAEMLVSAKAQVDTDMGLVKDKEGLKKLKSIDSKFEGYADNLTKLKFLLEKFADPNANMNGNEASELKDLLDQNKRIVGALNKQRVSDKKFNDKMTIYEKETGVHFRSQGIMEAEQLKLEKKYNIKNTQLWQDIADKTEESKKIIQEDFKKGLIEGIGGPMGALATKFFIPGFKAIKEYGIVAKDFAPKIGEFGKRVKGLFSGKVAVATEPNPEEVQASEEAVDATTSATDLQTAEMVNALEEQAQEIIASKQSITEAKGRKPKVFGRMLDQQIITNKHLEELSGIEFPEDIVKDINTVEVDTQLGIAGKSEQVNLEKEGVEEGVQISDNPVLWDMLNQMQSDRKQLDDMYNLLTGFALGQEQANSVVVKSTKLEESNKLESRDDVKMSQSDLSSINDTIKDSFTQEEFQAKKLEIMKDLAEDSYYMNKVDIEEDVKAQTEEMVVQTKILAALEEMKENSGDSDMTDEALGEVIGNALIPFLSKLGGLVALLGPLAVVLGSIAAWFKMNKDAQDLKENIFEKEKATVEKYKDTYATLTQEEKDKIKKEDAYGSLHLEAVTANNARHEERVKRKELYDKKVSLEETGQVVPEELKDVDYTIGDKFDEFMYQLNVKANEKAQRDKKLEVEANTTGQSDAVETDSSSIDTKNEIDREINKVDKQRIEIDNTKKETKEVKSKETAYMGAPSNPKGQNGAKRLDSISLLPDNLGLVFVNGGLNFG